MEYQKIINLLDNRPNQPSKFWTKHWVEVNDDLSGMYSTGSQIWFKTSVLNPSLCDYSDAYILVKGTMSVGALAAGGGNNNKQVILNNCDLFIDCISKISNTQIYDV